MSIYTEALISFSAGGIMFYHEVQGSMPEVVEVPCHLIIAECSEHSSVLLVCATLDGHACNDPPQVLRQLMVPDDEVQYACCTVQKKINFARPFQFKFSFEFREMADFWEVVRILCEIQITRTVQKNQIEGLIVRVLGSVSTLSSVSGEASSVAA